MREEKKLKQFACW